MMCDYQMFWHEHRKRPRLITSVTLGKGYTEFMKDDGKIGRIKYDMGRLMQDTMKEAIADLREQRSMLIDQFR